MNKKFEMEKNLKEYQLLNLGNYIQFVKKSKELDQLGFSPTYGLIHDIGSRNVIVELKNAKSFASYYDSTFDRVDENKTKLLRVYIKNLDSGYEVLPIVYYLRDGSILNQVHTYTFDKRECGPFKFCPRGCCFYLNKETRLTIYGKKSNYGEMFKVIYQGLLQNKLLAKKERIRKNKRKRTRVELKAYPEITMNIMKFLY